MYLLHLPPFLSFIPLSLQRYLIADTVARLPEEQARELAGMIKREVEKMHSK